MSTTISDTARSLVVIEEVVEGHRADIEATKKEMSEMRRAFGWVIKVPGFGYDELLKKLNRSVIQLESILLFRQALCDYEQSHKSVGLYVVH